MADYVKTNWQNSPSTQTPINAENLNHMEDGIYNAQAAADQAQAGVDSLNTRSYAPIPVTLAADMTDETKNYLYLGSEIGYDNGYLYYYNGSAWVRGNEYQAVQVITDKTLENEDEPADSKTVGDKIGELSSALTQIDGATVIPLESGGLYQATGIEYDDATKSRSGFIKVTPSKSITFLFNVSGVDSIYVFEFASNTETSSGVNEKLASGSKYNGFCFTVSENTNYVRFQITKNITDITTSVIMLSGGYNEQLSLGITTKNAILLNATSDNPIDLNDITDAGNYYVPSDDVVQYITNSPPEASAYKLVVLQTTTTNRMIQIALINSANTRRKIAVRNYAASGWSEWLNIASENYAKDLLKQTIKTTDVTITASNYLTYFANGSFNDATINSIYYIAKDVPLSNGPDGDNVYGSANHETRGYIQGVLMTYRSFAVSSTPKSGLTQLLIGYRNTDHKPTLSYRTAIYDNGYIWSNWSKFEEDGYLHASNDIVYAEKMALTFSDMNDMPQNTICQLDLNLNGSDADHTLANHPAPGVSCVAMCYAFSTSTPHGKVQTVYTLDGRLYWRYGYLQAANDYRWTSWKQCVMDDGTLMRNKGRLDNGSDLNDVKTNSIYLLGAQQNAGYVNTPLTTGSAYLTTRTNSAVIFQVIETLGGSRYTRYSDDSGATWSNWV